jgi:hypothetical protein
VTLPRSFRTRPGRRDDAHPTKEVALLACCLPSSLPPPTVMGVRPIDQRPTVPTQMIRAQSMFGGQRQQEISLDNAIPGLALMAAWRRYGARNPKL